MKISLSVFVLIILSNICVAQKDSSDIDVKLLYKCWTNSKEEYKKGSISFPYRPCDYKKFPAIEYRDRMELKENGECMWMYMGKNNVPAMAPGTWTYDKKFQMIVINDKSRNVMYTYKVVSLSKDLMMIQEGY